MSEQYWVGVDLGGTKTLAGLFDERFKLLGRAKEPTPREGGPPAVIRAIDAAVAAALAAAKVPADQVRGLGMGVPGQVDPVKHHVKYAPNLNWHDIDLPAILPKEWTWPTVIENDVRMGTYGEWKHGAAKGAKHVLGVFAGTGVGGGLILNGELYRGFNFNAGEIGHVIIHWRKGTDLESIAGRRSLFKRAAQWIADAPKQERKAWKGVDLDNAKSSLLADLFEKSDPVALQLIDDAAKALGAAIGSVINLLSPETVVIGGGMAGALGDTFLERVWEIATRYALPGAADGVRCVPAALKDDSGIYGAAAYARDQAQ